MKTERWEMDYELQTPPRWDPRVADSRRPMVVHLDQWCWDHILRDRAGECTQQDEEGIYEFLKDRSLSGEVVFPLSQGHYRENLVRENFDARWDTAVVMAELSGFTTFTPHGLEGWEALVGVASYCSLDVQIRKPNPFGWGFSHCLQGVESSAYILDTETGRRAEWDHLPPDQQLLVAHLEEESARRFELTLLAGREPRLEEAVMLEPFPPVANDDGARFEAQERQLSERLADHDATTEDIRNWLAFLSFRDSTDYVTAACLELGLSPAAVHDRIVERMDAGDLMGVRDFVRCLPIQGVFTELRTRTHIKGNFRFTSSDLIDFLTVATVLPFVDYVLVDKTTFNLMTTPDLGADVAKPLRRLADLRAVIESSGAMNP